MTRVPGRGSSLLMLSALVGCGDELVDGRFSAQQWDYLQTFRLPAPDLCPAGLGITGARCDDAARLGQALFFDRSYSGALLVGDDTTNGGLGKVGDEGKVACSDCHMPDAWFIDNRSRPNATSLGANWTKRNTPTLVNVGYYQASFLWDGNFDELWKVLEVPLTRAPLNSNAARLAAVIQADHGPAYAAAFGALPPLPFDDGEVAAIYRDSAWALELYQRKLVSGGSPFDRYLDGDTAAMSEEAKRGLELFIGRALCSECHGGPLLGDARYRVTGVAQRRAGADTAHVPAADRGRATITDEPADEGRFRTPGLRHVAETAPYMHAGQIGTLAGVIDFYRWGGDDAGFAGAKDPMMLPLELTDDDALDLEAFLRSLTGVPVAEELRR